MRMMRHHRGERTGPASPNGVQTRPIYAGDYTPTRFWKVGRGAAFDSQLSPQYGVARWAPVAFQPVPPKLACDPSDPSTWQRPYQFYQGGTPA